MLLPSLFPSLPLFAQMGRFAPPESFRTFLRATSYKFRPPRPEAFRPVVRHRQDALLARHEAEPRQHSHLLYESRPGAMPTIVLGGFVPDATEAVFLLRSTLLKAGGLYYLNYPRGGFSNELLFAQLDDLVDELNLLHGRPPVIFAISFGAGLLLEWLKRPRAAGPRPGVRGLILVSPVACVEDLLPVGAKKPSTLLGRALQPYLEANAAVDPKLVEKSRSIFHKMFEAGAQNKEAWRAILSRQELMYLRTAVQKTIREIDLEGACERVQSLKTLGSTGDFRPLSTAPALILYAEKESTVLDERSPTRRQLEGNPRAWFPQGLSRLVTSRRGSPVQHASLIFHFAEFQPLIAEFYRGLKTSKVRQAA